jgi:hypothetical protein
MCDGNENEFRLKKNNNSNWCFRNLATWIKFCKYTLGHLAKQINFYMFVIYYGKSARRRWRWLCSKVILFECGTQGTTLTTFLRALDARRKWIGTLYNISSAEHRIVAFLLRYSQTQMHSIIIWCTTVQCSPK